MPKEPQKPSPIDRALQRELLLLMRDEYPRTLLGIPEIPDASRESIYTNLRYLEEHGLCESGLLYGVDGRPSWGGATLTAKGLDFLEDDGGLSAILNVITVKLHADTLREILNARIDAVEIAPEERSGLKRIVASLSETALQAATTDLVQNGLHHIPDVVGWLQRFAGS